MCLYIYLLIKCVKYVSPPTWCIPSPSVHRKRAKRRLIRRSPKAGYGRDRRTAAVNSGAMMLYTALSRLYLSLDKILRRSPRNFTRDTKLSNHLSRASFFRASVAASASLLHLSATAPLYEGSFSLLTV